MPKRAPQQIEPTALHECADARPIGPTGKARRWTKEEDSLVRLNSGKMTHQAIASAIGRSAASVTRRVGVLQLSRRPVPPMWTDDDDAIFRTLYGKVDTGFLAGMLGRPVSALWAHAFCLSVQSRNRWSHEEDEILRAHFPRAPVSEFVHLLPGRTKKNIYYRAEVLSLARDLPYLLGPWHTKFHGYPAELREVIRLHNQVQRKLQDVEAQHRKPERPPVQRAGKPG